MHLHMSSRLKRTTMKFILLALMIALGIWAILQVASSRICTRPMSQEFKQTQEYKAMKCEGATQ